MKQIHLELLLGKKVLDMTGKSIGRIQELRAEQHGDEWVIVEYLIGPGAILERLSAWKLLQVLPILKASQAHRGHKVPWDQLDLTDPQKPRLLCTPDQLKQL